MKRLSKVVNIVPVIAKADTLTLEERDYFKRRVRAGGSYAPTSCPPSPPAPFPLPAPLAVPWQGREAERLAGSPAHSSGRGSARSHVAGGRARAPASSVCFSWIFVSAGEVWSSQPRGPFLLLLLSFSGWFLLFWEVDGAARRSWKTHPVQHRALIQEPGEKTSGFAELGKLYWGSKA